MRVVFLLLLGLLATSVCLADSRQDAHRFKNGPAETLGSARFSPAERHMIRAYFAEHERKQSRGKQQALPSGLNQKLAHGKPLPPGWQKKVTAGRSLDFQVYRHGTALPEVLLEKLPPSPSGSQILRVDDSIIRLHTATRSVLDLFDLVRTSP